MILINKSNTKKTIIFAILAFSLFTVFAEPEASEKADATQSEQEAEAQAADEAPAKKKNFFASFFNYAKNFPFSLDIGTEGALHGYNSYFSGKITWSPYFSTYGKLEVKNTLDNATRGVLPNEKYEAASRTHKIQLLPFEQNIFFDEDKGSLFSYGFGLDFRMDHTKTDSSGTSDLTQEMKDKLTDTKYNDVSLGDLYQISANQDNHLYGLGPLVRLYFKVPLTNSIIFNSESFLTPVMFVVNKESSTQKADLGHGIKESESRSYDENRWTYHSFEQTFHLDFFNFAAIVLSGSYTHEDINMIYPYMSGMPTAHYILDDISLKIGACLITVGKTFVRFKTGIFYEYDWKNYKASVGSTDYESLVKNGQVKISLGVNY